MRKKITVPEIRATKTSGEKFTLITCYDYTAASIVEKSDIEMILVGDSLGMIMLGYDDTMPVTVDDIIHHGKAVKRGAPSKFIIGDMPFGSYNESDLQAVQTANRFMKEIGCDAIKLEGGVRSASRIKAIVESGTPVVESGTPVCGHIGLTPQNASNMGGFKVQAKDTESAKQLLADAKAVEEAGAFMVMVEGVPADVTSYIRKNINIPILGLGAGVDSECQAIIMHDMLGYNDWVPKFAKKFANLGPQMLVGFNTYLEEVLSGPYPTPEY